MKSVRGISALSVLVLVVAACSCCDEVKRAATETVDKPTGIVALTAEDPNIVAEIGGHAITKQQLEERLISELRPNSYFPVRRPRPPGAGDVLMKMIAEEAMAIEGRKLDYLQDPGIQRRMKRFTEERLVNLALSANLKNQVITITADEVERKVQADPGLDRQRARVMLKREKTFVLADRLYTRLAEKFHVTKAMRNFKKAARIYQRLLSNSKSPYSVKFVTLKQIQNELTPEEKNLVLVTYDGGRIILEDWFDALHQVGPASRPRDLNTVRGFERFLDRAVLRKPVLVAEAKASGLDRDEDLLKQVRQREDRLLALKVRIEQTADINEPTAEQIIAYFNEHKEDFMTPPDTVRIEQIWCEDLDTAREVKAKLDSGGRFESLRQQYSLDKQTGPDNAAAGTEGLFFERLWNSEPGQIIGPLRGFYTKDLNWRIVKILEKKPGRMTEYAGDMDNNIKGRMRSARVEAKLAEYRKQLLEKYPHRVYPERFSDLVDFP